MKIITAVYEVYDKIKKTIAIDMIGKFRENHEIPGPTEKKDSGGGWFRKWLILWPKIGLTFSVYF